MLCNIYIWRSLCVPSGCRVHVMVQLLPRVLCLGSKQHTWGMYDPNKSPAHSLAACCVMAVMSCNDPQHQRSILDTVCKGPNDIQ
jgi:hypothetical protein